jgi:class 3 adenylate cyclase
MPAFISLKKSILFLLSGLVCTAGTAVLLTFLLSGPKLGPIYDFFLSKRQPSPVSHEILLINTDDFVESSDIFSVLMTLTEMESANLLLTARVAGSSSSVTESEAEIRRRFYEEYITLGNNIRNLFHAIRSGSVQPLQAPLYVDKLVELAENSRERLLSVLIDRDEHLLRSAAVFGNFEVVDFKPVFDWDGKLRRVNPIDKESSLEHPVYSSLKHRYAVSQIEDSEMGKFLVFMGYNDNKFEIPLDKEGNIIAPAHAGDFRSVDISVFREYDEASRIMRQVLRDADNIGAMSRILPEQSPLFLDDYAFALRESLLNAPDSEKRTAWIEARAAYIKNLGEFIYGPSEALLVKGYDEVIANEKTLKQEGLSKLAGMRDEVTFYFALMREKHNELIRVYNILIEELSSSFCIMGPKDNTAYSAILANSIITGSHIKPSYDRYALYWSFAAAVLILLIVFRLRPAVLLSVGFLLSFLAVVGFGWSFKLNAYWIDPTIVFGSSLSGIIVIFVCKCVTLKRRARLFSIAYGAAVSRDVLQELIGRGKPNITEVNVTAASVIAIRDFNLLNREDHEKTEEAGKSQKIFYDVVKKIVYKRGAVIAGFHGDTIIVCFGSPLDKEESINKVDPVDRAYTLVQELLKNDKFAAWRFGIDAGKCTFSWSPETGFTVNGSPVVRAKILASKNARFHTRALITDTIRDRTNLGVKKIGDLRNGYDAFYEMTV